jgi:hypothetical protein
MTEPATCEPPPEHRDVEWHWLRFGDRAPEPKHWIARHRRWEFVTSWLSPTSLAKRGWRYVGPARPPKEGE